MKAVMMIKALILIHLWSVLVAGCAWLLQRDGDGHVGASFPASGIWLVLIMLSLLPGVLHVMPLEAAISVPAIEAFDFFPLQAGDNAVDGSEPVNLLALYIGLSAILMGRTLWRWARLQSLPLLPTVEADIFTTTAEVPPLTLSWPRRAVVIPSEFQDNSALIRHERAHLRHYDAELTLVLLLLQDLFLRNPGISYLVRQWRLAIELRADHAATKMLARPERKDYAALLLNIQRPNNYDGKALPCPTARLTSTHHSNAKMRLVGIIEGQPAAKRRRWGAAIFLSAIGASTLGLTSAVATVSVRAIDMQSSPIVYTQKMSPQLPDRCPGLKVDSASVQEKELIVDGQLVPQKILFLGTVVLDHDVRRDGTVYNLRTIGSTHQCFEEHARAALAQWRTEPQEFEIQNAAVKLYFGASGETIEDIKAQLDGFFE